MKTKRTDSQYSHLSDYARVEGRALKVRNQPSNKFVPSVCIQRLCVTNEEYDTFLTCLSSEEAEKRRGTFSFEKAFADHPVTSISLYDALIYCIWKSKTSNELYRLPTEDEWNLAAHTYEFKYPWGNEEPFSEVGNEIVIRANYENILGATCPVYDFEGGCTREGVFNLAGNVWEWTMTLIDFNGVIIKGGAWDSMHYHIQNTHIGRAIWDCKYDRIGFRTVKQNLDDKLSVDMFFPRKHQALFTDFLTRNGALVSKFI
jgi:formylglycine-generating enzyme required for sulfatase activity